MTPEQIAAANLLARQMAQADPATAERILGDRSIYPIYLTDANGTVYLAEPARTTGPAVVLVLGDDWGKPVEPVDAVREALLADVEPMSTTGRALFILDALAAAGYVVTLSGGAHLPDRPGEAVTQAPRSAAPPAAPPSLMESLTASLAAVNRAKR